MCPIVTLDLEAKLRPSIGITSVTRCATIYSSLYCDRAVVRIVPLAEWIFCYLQGFNWQSWHLICSGHSDRFGLQFAIYTELKLVKPTSHFLQGAPIDWADGLLYTRLQLVMPSGFLCTRYSDHWRRRFSIYNVPFLYQRSDSEVTAKDSRVRFSCTRNI